MGRVLLMWSLLPGLLLHLSAQQRAESTQTRVVSDANTRADSGSAGVAQRRLQPAPPPGACRPLPALNHQQDLSNNPGYTCGEGEWNGTCTVQCELGFYQKDLNRNEATYTCLPNPDDPQHGVWTPPDNVPLNCDATSCRPAPSPPHSHGCNGKKETCTATCDAGYDAGTKSATFTCGTDGHYSGSLTCEARPCTGLENVIKGSVKAQECKGEFTANGTCTGAINPHFDGGGRFPSIVVLSCSDPATHMVCGGPNVPCDDQWSCSDSTGQYVPVADPNAKASTVQCSAPSRIPHCAKDNVISQPVFDGPNCSPKLPFCPSKCTHWIPAVCKPKGHHSVCTRCEPGYTSTTCDGASQTSTCEPLTCTPPAPVLNGQPIYKVAGEVKETPVFSGSDKVAELQRHQLPNQCQHDSRSRSQ